MSSDSLIEYKTKLIGSDIFRETIVLDHTRAFIVKFVLAELCVSSGERWRRVRYILGIMGVSPVSSLWMPSWTLDRMGRRGEGHQWKFDSKQV